MKIVIHQPQYMPWLGYMHKMASADLFVFLDDVQFKKNEWQHRNRLRNPDGWQWLSVPTHYKFPMRINEVSINDGWQKKHAGAIQGCYGTAPYFAEYRDLFDEYFSHSWTTIDRCSIDSAFLLARCIGIETPTAISSEFHFSGQSTQRLVNICRHFNADTYLAGAGGHDYMDLTLFDKAGIKVEFQDFAIPAYKQHWAKTEDTFIPGLSAVDLIFNCGPNSLLTLMGES